VLGSNCGRSVTGLSIDFFTINVFGFAAYTVSTYLFLFSPTIREQYAIHHPSAPVPSVQFNDLAFGVHALFLTTFMWAQFWAFGFKKDPTQRLGVGISGVMIGSVSAIGVVTLLAYLSVGGWEALDVVYTIGYVKLLISFIKYIPQAYLNYKRESTVGWSIHNILLDSTGGLLSIAQLFLDSAISGDIWGGTFGNPLKLGLGLVSLGFDALFLCQHFVWYRGKAPKDLISEGDGGSRQNRGDYGTMNPV